MKETKVGIVTQVRMTSTRLPGKVLKKVRGKYLLEYHLDRLNATGFPVIVATTSNAADDKIADLCNHLGVPIFRGDEHDVLSRYYLAAKAYSLDQVVRVTSDCPLIDGTIISEGIKSYRDQKDDFLYLSNCHKRTFPRGMDFEIFSFSMLETAFKNAKEVSEREHVTPYMWRNRDGRFRTQDIVNSTNDSKYRLTVDEPADFMLIENLINNFNADQLSCAEIVRILESRPDLVEINSWVEQKKV